MYKARNASAMERISWHGTDFLERNGFVHGTERIGTERIYMIHGTDWNGTDLIHTYMGLHLSPEVLINIR